jgi:hypothetical protein
MSVNGGAAAGMCNGACGGFANPEAFMAQQCQNCLDSYTSNYKTCLQQ